jgi:hypothetical protein
MSADESTNTVPELRLGEYITALIDALGDANPAAVARMRRVVGERRARIILDDEAVDVFFDAGRLRVQTAVDETEVDGVGETNSATVLALLDGYLEVEAAILNGRLRVFGAPEDTTRMFAAIEILLDASPRTPALQLLAARFRRERRERRGWPVPDQRRVTWYPFGPRASEYELLAQLGLLPSDSGSKLPQA